VLLQARMRMSPLQHVHAARKRAALSLLACARRVPAAYAFTAYLSVVFLQARTRKHVYAVRYNRLRRARQIQTAWRAHSARSFFARTCAAVVKLQSWARGRAVVSYMHKVVTYADWLHDEYLEGQQMDATYLGVPVAWMVLCAGDVNGGAGRRGDGSQEGFRRICLWAFREFPQGDAAGIASAAVASALAFVFILLVEKAGRLSCRKSPQESERLHCGGPFVVGFGVGDLKDLRQRVLVSSTFVICAYSPWYEHRHVRFTQMYTQTQHMYVCMFDVCISALSVEAGPLRQTSIPSTICAHCRASMHRKRAYMHASAAEFSCSKLSVRTSVYIHESMRK
jgi:hypothetical protein